MNVTVKKDSDIVVLDSYFIIHEEQHIKSCLDIGIINNNKYCLAVCYAARWGDRWGNTISPEEAENVVKNYTEKWGI